MKCKDVIRELEKLSPREYAMEWDNVGLLVGKEESEVKKILLALDPTLEVIQKAVEVKADMLITHHPLLFSPIKSITPKNAIGQKLFLLMEHGISCYAMHTNFDVLGGMADLAGNKLGLNRQEPLEETAVLDGNSVGIGKVGELPEEVSIKVLAEKIKDIFSLDKVMVYGNVEQKVKRVAISPGSGKSMIKEARKKAAEVLITGDIGHHEGIDAVEMNVAVIDATHYGLEKMFMNFLEEYLKRVCSEVEILSSNQKAPVHFL
ncbi:MAG: Nif3-like dinuclear metal center hexameric protein [Lachnospiraceae bacterium]|nr:Nif3-like dinuclear metal center hexameric protein [Lachnospiraceae bacterium]